jgi:hypothetical protein
VSESVSVSVFPSAVTWLMLAMTLTCYVLLIDSPGTSDVSAFWLRWIDIMRQHDVVEGYALARSDYSPGTFVCLAAVRWAGEAAGLSTFLTLKIAIVLAVWAGALIYWRWGRNLWHTITFLLALLINSAADGYLDAFFLPPLLLMLWALQTGRLFAAGLFLGVALTFKWQPLLVAPFVLVYACPVDMHDRRSWRRLGLLVIGATVPIALEMIVVGVQPLVASFRQATSHAALSYQALNLNWVIQMALHKAQGWSGPFMVVRPTRVLSRAISAGFFLTYVGVIALLWRRRHSFTDLLWCAFTGTLAYFTLNLGVHENHLFLAMVMAFCLLAAGAPRAAFAAAFCAVSLNVNLMLFYGLQGTMAVASAFTNAASICVSLINAAFFGLCLYEVVVDRQPGGPRRGDWRVPLRAD